MNEFVKDKYKNYNFVWRQKKYKKFVNKKSLEKNFEKEEEKFLDGRKKKEVREKEGKKKRRKERKN
jgi:hypothetical protein